MKIMVYNLKGGQGKTCIALHLALSAGFALVTNDPLSPVQEVLESGRFIKLKPGDPLPKFNADADIIFDWGGYADRRATEVLRQVEYVLVPTIPEFIDLQVSVDSIGEIERFNNNIVIVVNQTLKGDFERATDVLGKIFTYPVFQLKKSRSIPNVFHERKSVFDMVREGGAKRYHFQAVADQLQEVMNFIKVKNVESHVKDKKVQKRLESAR